ncbi:MAG TPA: phospholipase [Thermoanaerobaculia bacterium]|nr:phospholipase [Thermoanaerobaculia bacterium]
MKITRRQALQAGLGAITMACSSSDPGRLTARPTGKSSMQPGLHQLKLDRRALLYVPQNARGPFAVLLHGAGGEPDRIIARFRPQADEFGVVLLATKSRDRTWDAMSGRFGPDVSFLDRALNAAFEVCNVDARRLAVGGFSDGATYAVALGLANGDLFSHVLAFSPGFLIPLPRHGSAQFFLSHGTRDPILPIEGGSRRIARELRRAGLTVKLREFDGEHTIPPEVAREAFRWLAGGES